jgi:hypothetical protein
VLLFHIKDSRVTSGTARVPGTQRAGGFHLKGDDEMVNDDEIEEEMGFEKLCASGNCNSMPSKQKMQIKVNCKKSTKPLFYKVLFSYLQFTNVFFVDSL